MACRTSPALTELHGQITNSWGNTIPAGHVQQRSLRAPSERDAATDALPSSLAAMAAAQASPSATATDSVHRPRADPATHTLARLVSPEPCWSAGTSQPDPGSNPSTHLSVAAKRLSGRVPTGIHEPETGSGAMASDP